MKRCLALIILFENSPGGIDADYVKDNIPQYRDLSSTAFHRSFERDKDLLRSMGFVINYTNDKWELDSGYEITGNNIWKNIQEDLGQESINFLTTFMYFKNIINLDEGTDEQNNIENFSLLQSAISNKLRVSYTYKNNNRIVIPYAFKLYKGIWYLCALDEDLPKTFIVKYIDNIKVGKKSHNKDLSELSNITQFSWEKATNKISLNLEITKRTYYLYQHIFIHKRIQSIEEGENLLLDIETYDEQGLKVFLILTIDSCNSLSVNDDNFFKDMVNE